MKISVITPTYNCSEFIERSYHCLLSQSFTDWEWIVVDDGSTDRTQIIFSQISSSDSRVKYTRYDINKGRGFARNLAMSLATGEFISIWDIDDLYLSTHLERINECLSSKQYDFFYSNSLLLDKNLNIKSARESKQASLIYPQFTHATLGFRRQAPFNLTYDPSMRAGEDYELMITLNNLGKGFHCQDYSFMYVEDREVSINKTFKMHLSHARSFHRMVENKIINLSITDLLKSYFKFIIKSIILILLLPAPKIYLKTVKLRNSSHINPLLLTDEHLVLLKLFHTNTNES